MEMMTNKVMLDMINNMYKQMLPPGPVAEAIPVCGQATVFATFFDLRLPYSTDRVEILRQPNESAVRDLMKTRLLQSLKEVVEHLEGQ